MFYTGGFAVDGLVATTSIGIENVMCPSNSTSTSDCSGEIPPESPRCLNNFSAAGVRCVQGVYVDNPLISKLFQLAIYF